MNSWLVAAVVLVAALLPCLGVCVFTTAANALIALDIASVLTTTTLMLLSEGFHRQPFIDLAIVLALVSLVGSLAFARLMEGGL